MVLVWGCWWGSIQGGGVRVGVLLVMVSVQVPVWM